MARALPLQGRGRGFKSLNAHRNIARYYLGTLEPSQLAESNPCHVCAMSRFVCSFFEAVVDTTSHNHPSQPDMGGSWDLETCGQVFFSCPGHGFLPGRGLEFVQYGRDMVLDCAW